jgi:hypothetical protein
MKSSISESTGINCMKCGEHYIMDFTHIWGWLQIKCQHPKMNYHRTLKCIDPKELEALTELEPPKMCPLLREVKK